MIFLYTAQCSSIILTFTKEQPILHGFIAFKKHLRLKSSGFSEFTAEAQEAEGCSWPLYTYSKAVAIILMSFSMLRAQFSTSPISYREKKTYNMIGLDRTTLIYPI